MLKKIADLSGGNAYTASSLQQLKEVFTSLQEQIGYETRKGDASAGWLRLGAFILAMSALAALMIGAPASTPGVVSTPDCPSCCC